jgi:N-acyl-D-aspartate/D-glutamate deacylase
MPKSFDLVVRNGTVVDGTGAEPVSADVGVRDGRVAEVGRALGPGRDEIDAAGMLVTPGFVDVHTHYDGQVTWAPRVAPSSSHGVTTVVMGNCGVGFAPCRPEQRELLIRMMEGVEDIPEVVLTAGVAWEWETFPEYLDALERRRYDVDVCAQVPHSAVRVFAMGRRGADREPATAEDMHAMAAIVQDGIRAGALGFSTSRTLNHRFKDGRLAPSITAGEDELRTIALGMAELGQGVLQAVDSWGDVDSAFGMWMRVAVAAQRPVSFAVSQHRQYDPSWEPVLEKIREAAAAGMPVKGQFLCRPIGIMLGLDASYHPFSFSPSYAALERLPLADRVRRMRDPELRARLLAESPDNRNPQFLRVLRGVDDMFALGTPPNYAPRREDSFGERARRTGKPVLEIVYDELLQRDGHALLYAPANNFGGYTLDNVWRMLRHPDMIFGLGDGGAHSGIICDASAPTFMLTYWTRDRVGDRLTIPQAVRKLTSDTSAALGIADRGVVAPGYKADLNVIDYDALELRAPSMATDLPAGGRRMMQRADGYFATIVDGVATYRNGEWTGALPGRLVRGARS